MPISERPADRGARRGRSLQARVVQEFEIARRGNGISQRALGRSVRLSHSTIRRIARGEAGLTIVDAARIAAVLGLELGLTVHPDGDAVRDWVTSRF